MLKTILNTTSKELTDFLNSEYDNVMMRLTEIENREPFTSDDKTDFDRALGYSQALSDIANRFGITLQWIIDFENDVEEDMTVH